MHFLFHLFFKTAFTKTDMKSDWIALWLV